MQKEKYGFVYIWYDRKHKRFYIGSHWGTEDDRYVCSSNWMRQSYKRRKEDFKRRIIKKIYTTKKDLLIEEYKWLQLIKDEELGKKYYNLNKRIQNQWWSNNQEKVKTIGQKISEANKGSIPWNKGLLLEPHSLEHNKKISDSLKGENNPFHGKKHTDETKQKISEKNKGQHYSVETQFKKGSTVNQKKWIVISPDGNQQEVVNLKQFCQENDLNYMAMVKPYKSYEYKAIPSHNFF